MSEIVVLSGDPRPRSQTLALASGLGQAVAARRGNGPPGIVDVGELGAGLLTPGHEATDAALTAVQDAELLVVATPTVNGIFTGVLKVLLDRLPPNALAGIYAVPVVIADLQPQAELAEASLRRLLGALGADVADFGLAVVGSELAGAGPAQTRTLVEGYVAELRVACVQRLCPQH
jgi:FMN reductase